MLHQLLKQLCHLFRVSHIGGNAKEFCVLAKGCGFMQWLRTSANQNQFMTDIAADLPIPVPAPVIRATRSVMMSSMNIIKPDSPAEFNCITRK